jgi:hypothetical protein
MVILVDNFLVKLYVEQQANSIITKVLGADVAAFKAAISDSWQTPKSLIKCCD